MRKPRIIFFDIDGTLIDMEKKRITKPTLDALRRLQQNGILLAIATGRSPLIVPRFDGVEFDVFLTYNGSYCYDRRGDIFASPIPPQDVQTILKNAAALGRPVSVAGRTQLLSNGTDDDLTAYYAIGGRAPVISDKFDEVSRGEVFQLLMGCRESDWPAILKGTSGAKIAAWWDRAVDIIPTSGGKGAGIRKVLAHYGLTKEDAMEEFMFLGLRRMQGISGTQFENCFGNTIEEIYGDVIEKLEQEKMLEVKEDKIRLTKRGIDVSNYVFCEFLL